jgi:predicted SnoaL-like aldol condensation-catalyzing enzyme
MKTTVAKLAATTAPSALALLLAFAAFADSINPATKPQTSPAMDAKEKANLQFVMDWWRDVVEGGHLDLTTKYQHDDYIQHNPNVPTGREAFVAFFRDVVQVKPKNPIPATLTNPPVVSGAKGDFVFLIFEQEQKHPADAAKTYRSNSFEILRLANGKVQEHWDSAKRVALPPGAPKPPAFGQRSRRWRAAAPARSRPRRSAISRSGWWSSRTCSSTVISSSRTR